MNSATEMKVPLFRPMLGKDELTLLARTFKTGWVGLGPRVAEFEGEIARHQGRKFAVGVNSCTAALHLALDVLDLPAGSEVLVPTVTFISTPHAVEYNRLKVVFVDVREDDLCMDVADFERKITKKTKAVIPVHMGGQPCRMDEIMRIARRRGLYVIEDVANAQGGEWKGRKLGSWGDIGALSFEAKKNMTTGDGGMLIFDEKRWLSRVQKMCRVGVGRDTWKRFQNPNGRYAWYYEVDTLGYKYNMNDIAASMGLCQIKKLDANNAAKRSMIGRYIEELRGVGDIHIPPYDLEKGGYWLFIVHTDHRDRLIEFMADRGVTCGVHFMPTHLHPYYRKRLPRTKLPTSERVWRRVVSLPLFPSMTRREQDWVIRGVREFFKRGV